MNRRGFLSTLIQAGIGFNILPAAATYARRWMKQRDIYVPVAGSLVGAGMYWQLYPGSISDAQIVTLTPEQIDQLLR